MKAALYARVSTVQHGQDPEVQLRELREYVDRRGWTLAAEFIDRGVSGAKDRRPELDKLMAEARRRRFDVLVVWRFDRFARSVSHLVRALDEFRALGIEFVSLTEAIDTSTPAGRLIFAVLAAIAEFERNLIAERVCAGIRHARAKGVKLGRPRRSDVDPRQVARLRARGMTWLQIAAKLQCGLGTAVRAGRTAAP
jgi:DNA invertase Pin-like site-specific DNA recombinase